MKKGWRGWMGISIIIGLFLGGAVEALAKEKEVSIGYIGPLTGGAAFLGVDSLNGCLLAAEEINAAGGITVAGQKYRIKIESYDDEATPAKAVAGLKKLKDLYDIPVVIDNVSGSAMAITEINERMGILWSGFARHPGVTARGNKLVLRMHQPAPRDNEIVAQGAVEVLKAKKFATLCDAGDYGRELCASFIKSMEARGGSLLGSEWFDMRKDTDFRVQITKIKALNPETIFIAAYDEATAQVINQCRELGLKIPLSLTVGFQIKGEEIAGAKNIEGCINAMGIGNLDPLPRVIATYRSNYKKKFKQDPGSYGENNYELLYIIARGMEKAGNVTEAIKIKEGMKAVVPIEDSHRTFFLMKWDENGEGLVWRALGIYRKGTRVQVK
jgi:branched-chain amino acid transport system substrate-binding protein